MSMTLYLDSESNWLKVELASFQYQMTRDNASWVFRYDYVRTPPEPEPAGHLHLRGKPAEDCLPPEVELQDVHFPTGRISIEAVIRLLVESFGVPCNGWHNRWRAVLAESERAFLEIARRPISGPAS
jgi:hypothetical protein